MGLMYGALLTLVDSEECYRLCHKAKIYVSFHQRLKKVNKHENTICMALSQTLMILEEHQKQIS